MEVLDFISHIFDFTGDVPIKFTTTIGTFAILIVLWVKLRKINIEERMGHGNVFSQQLSDLQNLTRELTKELSLARQEIAAISAQNRELRQHITQLEEMLRHHKITISSCN